MGNVKTLQCSHEYNEIYSRRPTAAEWGTSPITGLVKFLQNDRIRMAVGGGAPPEALPAARRLRRPVDCRRPAAAAAAWRCIPRHTGERGEGPIWGKRRDAPAPFPVPRRPGPESRHGWKERSTQHYPFDSIPEQRLGRQRAGQECTPFLSLPGKAGKTI